MHRAIPAALLLAACGAAPMTGAQGPSAASAPVTTPILRTAQTISGQPLRPMPEGGELTAAVTEVPPAGRIPPRQHPWPRYVYVERGPIRVINLDTGETREFASGQVIVEAVGQWHEGYAPGPAGARLVGFDLVPPGAANLVRR